MEIAINDIKKIDSIQKEFNSTFPYLKIEFFAKSQKTNIRSTQRSSNYNRTVGDCRNNHTNGTINIKPEMTVAELEKKFRERFGLFTQIFRKSGNVWLETTITDSWTLHEQNKQGEELSKNNR